MPQGALADLNAGKVVLVLEQVVDLCVGNVGLDGDRRQEVVLPLLQITVDAPVGHLQEPRNPAERLLAPLGRELVEGGRPELRDRTGNVRDKHVSVAVDDRPPLRGRTEGAHLVVPRVLEIGLPGDHLQSPEAKEENAEDRHGEDAHGGDAQGHLGREAIGLLDARVGRQEAGKAGARQRGSPHGALAALRGRSVGRGRRADRPTAC